jgi:predicted lipoprotein with Yx(FWY)xxD motif
MFRPVLLLAAAVGLLAAACAGGSTATPLRTVAPTVAATAAPLTAAPSAAASTVSISTGGYFVGPNGMTLYTFDKDALGTTNCFDKCLDNWPALTVDGATAITLGAGLTSTDFTTVTRSDDSSLQVAFKQIPLYYFIGDTAPGQTNGEGVGGVWHTATISSTLPPPAPSTAASAAPSASAGAEGIEVETGGDGAYLVGPEGMTLYIFDNDGDGPESTCYEQCADNWPPLLVEEDQGATGGDGVDGAFGVTERTDDTYQVTYNGLPLYYFIGDQAAGDTNGDGVGDVWHLAQP